MISPQSFMRDVAPHYYLVRVIERKYEHETNASQSPPTSPSLSRIRWINMRERNERKFSRFSLNFIQKILFLLYIFNWF